MRYRKDLRQKNLTLRDIHVGDWVQVWSEQSERYSAPLKIIQICDDGTIYLVTDDEERCTPWEENIKNVDVLPITCDILRGFGFDIDFKSKDHLAGFVSYKGSRITCIQKRLDHRGFLIPEVPFDTGEYQAGIYTDLNEFLYACENTIKMKIKWQGIDVNM